MIRLSSDDLDYHHLFYLIIIVGRIHVSDYVTATGDKISYLNITAVETNDGGLYKCEAASKVGSVAHTGHLYVHGIPYIRPMEKKMIVAGGTLIVTCPVAGYPIESILWERGKFIYYF